MTIPSWADSPIHEQIRAAGLDPISERAELGPTDATACSRVLNALRRLYEAADIYVACQDRATDERCGLVQPITVADGNELIAAQCEALEILQSAENEGWVYSAND